MKVVKKLAQLKLVAGTGIDKGKDVQAQRRLKLIGKLRQQLDAAKAEQDGIAFTVARTRRLKDKETGTLQLVTVQRPVPKFYFADARGKWYFQLRYGSKRLVVLDGKDTVEVGEKKDLLPVIATLIEAVEQGELDEQLRGVGKASKGARSGSDKAAARP
jgi:hypothetical protein